MVDVLSVNSKEDPWSGSPDLYVAFLLKFKQGEVNCLVARLYPQPKEAPATGSTSKKVTGISAIAGHGENATTNATMTAVAIGNACLYRIVNILLSLIVVSLLRFVNTLNMAINDFLICMKDLCQDHRNPLG
jgi:hypothetical protein